MMGVLIVTHGDLAASLLDSAQRIAGVPLPFKTLSLDWNQPFEEIRRAAEEALDAADEGLGVLMLTDLFGGTPTNVALSFLRERENVEVVTGVNLPMVVRLASLGTEPEKSLRDVARELAAKGAQSIHHLSGYAVKPSGSSH